MGFWARFSFLSFGNEPAYKLDNN